MLRLLAAGLFISVTVENLVLKRQMFTLIEDELYIISLIRNDKGVSSSENLTGSLRQRGQRRIRQFLGLGSTTIGQMQTFDLLMVISPSIK